MAGLLVVLPLYHLVNTGCGETFSLADDFSETENGTKGPWSYRMEVRADGRLEFPQLPCCTRDANAVWGSNFAEPPRMWSDPSGYWGIGRNASGRELFSSRNDTRWAPGDVLLHPKAGESPAGLAVAWTAPRDTIVDMRYEFELASPQGGGVGYRILKRHDDDLEELVVLPNIGAGVANELHHVFVTRGDVLYFCADTAGDPVGDIVRVAITIGDAEVEASPEPLVTGGVLTAGSDFQLALNHPHAGMAQWCKDGQPIAGATGETFWMRRANPADSGRYTVRMGAQVSQEAKVQVVPAKPRPDPNASRTPRQVFAETLPEQERELETNELMRRFALSRRKLAALPHRPAYHFVSPENMLNDPNGLCFWKGRWHLFYQAYPPDEFPDSQDIKKRRQHWGHAVSEDLVHWRDLPYAIYPGPERMCFSGSTLVEDERVIAFYPGIGAGQMVAVSDDPLLLNWEKIGPVNSGHGDSDLWKEGDTYFGLVGRSLWTSKDLKSWESRGEFLTALPFLRPDDDGACPNFERLGDKHLLAFFSHSNGGQYYLGDYRDNRFTPYAHGRFNHGRVAPGGVHAPSTAMDGDGGVVNILNINDGRYSEHWDQIMSVPQRLTLGDDKLLRVRPIESLATLRREHRQVAKTVLPANKEVVLESIHGNTMELELEIDPQESRWVQLNVLRSPGQEEQTSIAFYNFERELTYWYQTPGEVVLDGTRSSELPDVWIRPPERVTVRRDGEPLRLRVLLDRSVVEVFVNDRQYLAMRVYPGRDDSLGVSLRAQGQPAVLQHLNAWHLQPIWP
jgi:beta-fructofuranosidase